MDRGTLPHSACHQEHSLIFSVRHAVLDDKMETAAILSMLMLTEFLFTFTVPRDDNQPPPPPTLGEDDSHIGPSASSLAA